MNEPLKGLTVIDVSTVLAGPSVGMFFAELGARVIKVEHPNHPDVTRSWKLPVEPSDKTISAYFSSINYKKEYRPLNLKQPDDLSIFFELISSADILLSNFKRGDAEKFGIEDDVLLKKNPRLIIGKINGYGQHSDRVAYDLILQAESGFMSINGTRESGPVKMPVAMVDVLAGHHLKEAVLLALYEREKTGQGSSLSVSLYDAAVSNLVNQASNYLMTGQVPERMGSLHPNIAPYGELFTTEDEQVITLAIGSDMHFARLCFILGLEELPTHSRFNTVQNRVRYRSELFGYLDAAIRTWHSDDFLAAMRDQHVPAGAVLSIDQVMDKPEAKSLIREEIIDGVKTKRITSVIFQSHGNPIS